MSPAISSQSAEVEFQTWIIQFNQDVVRSMTSVTDTASLLQGLPGEFQIVRGLGNAGLVVVDTWGTSPDVVSGWFARDIDIAGFERDVQISSGAIPNDPSFGGLWGLENTGQGGGKVDADIDAPAAWDLTTGSSSIIVAVIDTGINYNHPDLAANMWHNPGETPGDGMDNDGNGFVDDYYGWDFANDDSDPMDDNNHGTHVAGTIGAVGNNGIGVVGVNWDVSLMALKFLDSAGSGFTSDAIAALNYVTMMKERGNNIRATNNSWSGSSGSSSLSNAIAANRDEGILFIGAAGNSGSNNDTTPVYPSSFTLDNVISVAATDKNDNKASYSNYGLVSVDLAAPGSGIYSTLKNGGYGSLNGTSMATPHVAGAAALAWSLFPDATYLEIRDAILAGADPLASLAGKVATGGRLNVANTLNQLLATETVTPSSYLAAATTYEPLDLVAGAPGVISVLDGVNDGSATINLGASTFSFYGTAYTGASSLYVSDNGLITFGSANTSAANIDLSTSPTQATIAPFWDDFRTDLAGADSLLAKFEDTTGDGVADRLIIEWSDVSHSPSSPSTATFQAILQLNTGLADGAIVFNYVDLDLGDVTLNDGKSATVGIKNAGSQVLERLLVAQNNGVHPLISSSHAIVLDRTRPDGLIAGVSPDPRTDPVPSIDVTFTEPIDAASFDYRDLSLTLNGGPNLVTSSLTVSYVAGTTYRINGLTGLTSDAGAYTLSVNLASITDALGHPGLGTISESWVVNPASTVVPNIQMQSASADGANTLTLTYVIEAAAIGPFNIGIYRSDDEVFGGDALVSTVSVVNPSDLTIGTHVITRTIGGAAGQIALPGAGTSDFSSDYFLLAVADPTDTIAETDPTAPGADNVVVFTGVYHVAQGAVVIQAGAADDTFTANGALAFNFGGTDFSYAPGDVNGIFVRLHAGNDSLNGSGISVPIIAYGGIGDDTLVGGSGSDSLIGGAGDDTYVFDADAPLGSDTIDEAGGGIDTLDFSGTTTLAVALNLATATAQTVNTNLTLALGSATTIENVIGGALGDTLTGNDLANQFNGGGGNDTLAGAGGNDTLVGGAANDTYVFATDTPLGSDNIDESGGGIDTLDFSGTTTLAVAVNLGVAAAQTVNANLTLTLGSATTIENVIGGALGDLLTGNDLANVMTGGSGNDILTGGAGNDSLAGETGDDTYVLDTDSQLGSDTINESGGGADTLDFSGTSTLGIVVNLGTTAAQVVNTNLTLTLGSSTTIENVIGGALGDTLTGNILDNVFEGGSGNDILIGAAGDDTYVFDTDTALGNDTIDESGGGIETLDFSTTTTQSVVVNLGKSGYQVVNENLALTLSSSSTIENVIGGSLADTLTGNSLANGITGGGGNDTLNGSAGNDTYVFDADFLLGGDTVIEYSGVDTLDFSLTTAVGIAVDLSIATLQVVNHNLSLTLSAGNSIDNVTGSSLDDVLIGNTLANTLSGGAGNDTLTGNAGNDVLIGGAGNDLLSGGGGHDTYVFAADSSLGSDIVDESGGGTDGLDFSATATTGVSIDLSLTTAQVVNENLTLTLSGGVIEDVTGGSHDDTLIGNALSNRLSGGAGNDTLVGNAAIDQLTGGSGDDLLVGGLGNDTYLFDADSFLGSDSIVELPGGGTDHFDFSSTTGMSISLDLSLTIAQAVNDNLTITLSGSDVVENVTGGSLGDVITGNALANSLAGGPGDDLLIGNAGNDTLYGMAGNDTLVGGSGNNVYSFDADLPLDSDTVVELPGGGTDLLDFSATRYLAIKVNLSLTTAQVVNDNLTLTLNAADVIENVTGGWLDDELTGNALANVLTGGIGNDLLVGNAGNDTLIGLAGNDTLVGGSGNNIYWYDADAPLGSDTIVELPGEGTDLLDFSATRYLAINVDLSLTTAQVVNSNLTLTLSAGNVIEDVTGGFLDDVLTGNDLANALAGGQGNDTLNGGDGDDTLNGAAGNDVLTGGNGADTLIGAAGNDLLTGGSGDDVYSFNINSGLGTDTLVESSGGGIDLLDFSTSTYAGISLNLGLTSAQLVNSSLTLILSSSSAFEMVIGTSKNDSILGNALNNVLIGGAGNDFIQVQAGRNLIVGGSGSDILIGGLDDDLLVPGTLTYFNESTKLFDRQAIDAVMAEWTRLDADYLDRISHLKSGGGLNGSTKLDGSTVLADGSTIDTLTGGAGLDWFWQFANDTIADLHLGGTESVN